MGIIKDFPFNMNYTCAENLREVPEDAVAMRKGVDWLQGKLDELDPNDKVQETILLSQLSSFARIIGDLELAESSLTKAIEILTEFKRFDQVFAMNLRMGMVYQSGESYSKAEEIYLRSLKEYEASTDSKIKKYGDVIFHQYGRLRFEQGFYKEALDLFMRAYEERIVKGDLELLNATEFAIAQTRKQFEEVN